MNSKKILAVSGGIDSMVLLDMYKNDDIIVAHFNHGTRPSADEDEKFVQNYCSKHNIPFVSEKALLGTHVSEENARKARYDFLFKIATKNQARILTAHHQNDLFESITINLLRGTGWRGLTPLSNKNIDRPLLHMTKLDIVKYAAEHQIYYREDPTNSSENYLRNRVRPLIKELGNKEQAQLYQLYLKQQELRTEIEEILESFLNSDGLYQRELFTSILNHETSMELLKTITQHANISATRPQLETFLYAIQTYQPGKYFNLPNNKLVKLHKTHFVLK